MSKICKASYNCPFAPEQTTVGCPCADLCPGYVDTNETKCWTETIPGVKTTSSDTYSMKREVRAGVEDGFDAHKTPVGMRLDAGIFD